MLDKISSIKPFCHLLIGIPGSGKSTFAEEWVAADSRYRIVSTDQIRTRIFGDANIQGAWPIVEAQVLAEIRTHISAKCSVIYDATNAKREWRQQFLQHFQTAEYSAAVRWMAWIVDTPLDICQQRNQHRSRQVPATVIETLETDLKDSPPDVDEGFVAIHTVPLKTDGRFDLAAVFRQLDQQ